MACGPRWRVGVNSGLVVVAQIGGGSGPLTALGGTVNLARDADRESPSVFGLVSIR